jgi:hypothetical protein
MLAIDQVVTVISFVRTRKYEDLSIGQEQRTKACARLPKKGLFTDNATELFGSGIPCNPSR